MKVRYIAIYKIRGANKLPEEVESASLLALQTPTITATLTTNPEPGMGNGAMPNGPSYRAHPRLYPLGRPAFGVRRPLRAAVTRSSRREGCIVPYRTFG